LVGAANFVGGNARQVVHEIERARLVRQFAQQFSRDRRSIVLCRHMDSRGKRERTGQHGRQSGARDLIGDIHRQQRRKLFRRAAQLVALAIALLLVGLGVKIVADGRARLVALERARVELVAGTLVDVREAADELEKARSHDEDDPILRSALALARAHAWIEFGELEAPMRAAVDALEDVDMRDAHVARALLAIGDGELERAETELDSASSTARDPSIAPDHDAFAFAMLALAHDPDPSRLAQALARVEQALVEQPDASCHRRALVALQLVSGAQDKAMGELAKARQQHRTHVGLAVDEALYRAHLRKDLGAAADVADQVIASDAGALGARDLARAHIARGLVHVLSGETELGLSRIEEAWKGVPSWDEPTRRTAVEIVLAAGDHGLADALLADGGFSELESSIYRAWSMLARGDVMTALAGLAELPQEHPRVGYLQALALVEQGRHQEATAWLDRTERLLPGLVEIEIARARMELHLFDVAVATRRLEALAQERPFAPRAWTGLGEAYLVQDDIAGVRKAQKALERALEREPVPAEAALLLARVWQKRRKTEGEAGAKTLALLERAAELNPELPRYREALALELVDLGLFARARPVLEALLTSPGVSARVPLALVRVATEEADSGQHVLPDTADGWLETARELGASETDMVRERARVLLGRTRREDAVEASVLLDRLLTADPLDIDARVLLARALIQQQQRKEAELALRRGLQLVSPDRQGRLYLAWATIEARAGDRRRGAAHARVAWLRLLEEDRPAAELVAAAELTTGLWIRQDKPKIALLVARELTERLPAHGGAWTVRAGTELAANDTISAQRSIERALDLDDTNPRSHEINGHTFLRFGHKEQARVAYERAIELANGTSLEPKYRENLARL